MGAVMVDIAIIGAGLSGLTLAHKLKGVGDVRVYEQADRCGGRMVSVNVEDYAFDYGAQFFKVKTAGFADFIKPMIDRGVIAPWHARFVEFEEHHITWRRQWDDQVPNYVCVPGMGALAEALAQEVSVQLNTQVHRIEKERTWALYDQDGGLITEADWVVSTLPAANALRLLPACFAHRAAMDRIEMQACFSLMLGFKNPLDLDFDAALVRGADISWISVNSSKPGRDSGYSLLVHATNRWADCHMNDQASEIMAYLCNQTTTVLSQTVAHADHMSLHRWPYANVAKHKQQQIYMDPCAQLAACGDWCIQGRIEAAYESAALLGLEIEKVMH